MRHPARGSLQPRSYQGHDDLERMQNLLVAGRKSANGSYYVHTGDLKWWTYYTYPEQELWEYIYLWDSPYRDGTLEGWALLNPLWRTFDVFVMPALRDSDYAQKMYIWAEERATEIAASQGKNDIYTIWISAGDRALISHFEARGFARHHEYHVCMMRALDEDLPQVKLPAGYQVRDMSNEEDIELRASASYVAFQSRTPWERYLQRYRRFRCSPVYKPHNDLVVAAPDGRITSFCIIWLDGENRVGLFEPVGTHPEFQRLGLGRAVLLAGMERMCAEGMHTAVVNTSNTNLGAQQLYRAVGFQEQDRLYTFTKKLDNTLDKGQQHGG